MDYPGQDSFRYCVFGKVIEGMDIVDQIAKVPMGNHASNHQDVPKNQLLLMKAQKINITDSAIFISDLHLTDNASNNTFLNFLEHSSV